MPLTWNLPKRALSIEGKRHVETVPVKICKAQNDHYDKHEDADFCFSIAEDVHCLASLLGPDEVIFISPDDKAVLKSELLQPSCKLLW